MRWVLVLMTLAGCLEADIVQCPSGAICPSGYTCGETGGCIAPGLLDACADKLDGDACDLAGVSGECDGGLCVPISCGNGRVEAGEVCDDGDHEDFDGCRADCLSDETCGNGVIDPGLDEQCDCGTDADAVPAGCSAPNSDAGGVCRTDCKLHCGDGERTGLELCDGDDLGGSTCTDFGFHAPGGLACSAACTFDIAACGGGYCGDGVINGNEICEGVAPALETCVQYGFDAGPLRCTNGCVVAFDRCRRIGWKEMPSPTINDLHAIWASSSSDVYVVGAVATIAHFDGGAWSLVDGGNASSFSDVWGTSSSDVFAVGSSLDVEQSNLVYHFDGTSWTDQDAPEIGHLESVHGTSATDVFAAGNGIVLHFDGTAWSIQSTDLGIGEVWASSSTDVWGSEGTARYHYDGSSWSYLGQFAPIFGFWGTSPGNLYAASQGAVLHYDGSQWSSIDAGTTQVLGSISGTPTGELFTTTNDRVHHFDGQVWSSLFQTDATTWLEDVWAFSASDAIAVGAHGTLLRYLGSAWAAPRPGQPAATQVFATSDTNVFAASDRTVYHFDGAQWTEATTAPEAIFDLWSSGPDDAYAVGTNGLLLHFDGTSWTQASGLPTTDLDCISVWGSAADDVYVPTTEAGVMHFDGTSWSTLSNTPAAIREFFGVDGELLALGYSSVYRRDGAGWTDLGGPGVLGLHTMWGSALDDLYVIGHGFWHFDGTSWSGVPLPITPTLYAVWGTGPNDVFASGVEGALLHYDGTGWGPIDVASEDTYVGPVGGTYGRVWVPVADGLPLRELVRSAPWAP